jgi:hypothetical protein
MPGKQACEEHERCGHQATSLMERDMADSHQREQAADECEREQHRIESDWPSFEQQPGRVYGSCGMLGGVTGGTAGGGGRLGTSGTETVGGVTGAAIVVGSGTLTVGKDAVTGAIVVVTVCVTAST